MCQKFGYLSPEGLFRDIDAQDLAWWMAYYRARPFGDLRDDLRMQRICEAIACASWTGKGQRPTMDDFALFSSSPAQTAEDQIKIFAAITAGQAGRDK